MGFSYRKCIEAVFANRGRGDNKRGRNDAFDDTPAKRPKMEFTPNIVAVVEGLAAGADFRFADIVLGIVKSPPFSMRRTAS